MAFTIRHKKQTLADFQNDCHRFSLLYNGKQSEVACYGACDVLFDDKSIPEDVLCDVQQVIWSLIDMNENRYWAVPDGAQEIADAYCAENFR